MMSISPNSPLPDQPAQLDQIETAEISIIAYRLIRHLKFIAVEGLVRKGVRPLARGCKMSLSSVVIAKRELVEMGLIQIVVLGNPKTSTPDTIKILV